MIPLLRGSEEQCCWFSNRRAMMWSLMTSGGHMPGGRRRWTRECTRSADRGNDPKGVSICSWHASALRLASSVRSTPSRRGIGVRLPGMVGSQGTHDSRSALGHQHLGDVTRLHHEEVAESDFAARVFALFSSRTTCLSLESRVRWAGPNRSNPIWSDHVQARSLGTGFCQPFASTTICSARGPLASSSLSCKIPVTPQIKDLQ